MGGCNRLLNLEWLTCEVAELVSDGNHIIVLGALVAGDGTRKPLGA
jgi:flavin reductase (DIM6/NTAB) family NADH-FMN oxidoreductase RutF